MCRRVLIASPIGFCGGVRNALGLFARLREQNPGEPTYVLHELVHNELVTARMLRDGAIFVDSPSSVPRGARILIGAHGCGDGVLAECRARGLEIIDATCPFVRRLQDEVAGYSEAATVVFLGDRRHPEVQGVLDRLHGREYHLVTCADEARALPAISRAVFFNQTTRSHDEVERTLEALRGRVELLDDQSHICEAVACRQDSMSQVAPRCQFVYVIGSPHSSNARRLEAVARGCCPGRVKMVDSAGGVVEKELENVECVGVGTATSSPDCEIDAVLARLEELGFSREE